MKNVCCSRTISHAIRSATRPRPLAVKPFAGSHHFRGLADVSSHLSQEPLAAAHPAILPTIEANEETQDGPASKEPKPLVRKVYQLPIKTSGDNFIQLGTEKFHPVWLRDACTCHLCVNPSSKQKNFQTTDIPESIAASRIQSMPDRRIRIQWKNDIVGWPVGHHSIFPQSFFTTYQTPTAILKDRFQALTARSWNKERISKHLEYVEYDDYMNNERTLHRAIWNLYRNGLLLVRGVPRRENAVEDITSRIGILRDTFYGRTWDVRSVPEAKNVAYTSQFLGLHMDLLYMANPPGFQFLHCMTNTCEGGASLFSDAFWAAERLSSVHFKTLTKANLAYHYKNDGHHYYFRHPLFEVSNFEPGLSSRRKVAQVNYSPPFQANHITVGKEQVGVFSKTLGALKAFAECVETPENLFEYKLNEGECVIFNNRRVLHGRRQFDTSEGERWLKGAYVDGDVMMSRYRVLSERYQDTPQMELRDEASYVSGVRPEPQNIHQKVGHDDPSAPEHSSNIRRPLRNLRAGNVGQLQA